MTNAKNHALATPRTGTSRTALTPDQRTAFLFIGPSALLLTVFVLFPMAKTVYLSFFLTNDLGKPTVFAGLQNYGSLLTNPAYLKSLWATVLYVAFVTVLTVVFGLVLAVCANQKLRGIGFFKTAFTSTMGISVSVAAIFWLFIFNPAIGLLDQVSALLGLPAANWLTDPHLALPAIIISSVWMNLGFTFLILFGAFQAVPKSLYEAADIAGVGKGRQFFHVTLPAIFPTLFFVVVVTVIESFKSFGLIDMMTAGGPNNATNLMVYRIYQDAFLNGNYGLASSESVILGVLIAICTFLQFKLYRKMGD